MLGARSAAANFDFSLKAKSFVYVLSGALDRASISSSSFPDFKTFTSSKGFDSGKGDIRAGASSG